MHAQSEDSFFLTQHPGLFDFNEFYVSAVCVLLLPELCVTASARC